MYILYTTHIMCTAALFYVCTYIPILFSILIQHLTQIETKSTRYEQTLRHEYHSTSRSIATNQPIRWVTISTRGEFD